MRNAIVGMRNTFPRSILFPEPSLPLSSGTGTRVRFHSGQTTGYARDLSTSGRFPVTFPFNHTEFPRSTSATPAIAVPSPIILPLQTFFSRVLLLRQQAFSSGSLPQRGRRQQKVFMFRYERVNSTRKFSTVVEIVSLLKKIYDRDAPLRAVFKVKTLAVLFPPIPAK